MTNNKKFAIMFAVIMVLTGIITSFVTVKIYYAVKKNPEDVMLVSLVGKDKADELEERTYKYRRTYMFTDGIEDYTTDWNFGTGLFGEE